MESQIKYILITDIILNKCSPDAFHKCPKISKYCKGNSLKILNMKNNLHFHDNFTIRKCIDKLYMYFLPL